MKQNEIEKQKDDMRKREGKRKERERERERRGKKRENRKERDERMVVRNSCILMIVPKVHFFH